MINQLLAGVHIAAACEAMTFAAKQGLDLAQGLRGHHRLGGQLLDVREPRAHILDGDYRPLSAVDIFVKDLGIIQDMARAADASPCRSRPRPCRCILRPSGAGMGRDDDASLARTYAALSGAELPDRAADA